MLIRSARARDMLGGMLMVSDMPVAGGREGLARGASPDTAQAVGTAVRNFPRFPATKPLRPHQALHTDQEGPGRDGRQLAGHGLV